MSPKLGILTLGDTFPVRFRCHQNTRKRILVTSAECARLAEGEESNALEGKMTTDSFRKARDEFGSKLKCVFCAEIGRELLKEIV